MTAPSAKAAQQIVQLCGVRIMELNVGSTVDLSGLTKQATEDRIATIIEMALSDSLRPYRELVEKWREDAIRKHNLISAAPDDAKQAVGWIPTQQQFLESVNHIRKELSTYLRLRANKEGVVDSLKSLDRIIFNEEMVLQAIASGRYAKADVAPDDGKGQTVTLDKRDLYDFVRGAIKTAMHCQPITSESEAWETAHAMTEECLTKAYGAPVSAPQGWQQGAEELVAKWRADFKRNCPPSSGQPEYSTETWHRFHAFSVAADQLEVILKRWEGK